MEYRRYIFPGNFQLFLKNAQTTFLSVFSGWLLNSTFFHNENSYFVYQWRKEHESIRDLMISYCYCVAAGSIFLIQVMRVGPFWGPSLLWWNEDQLKNVATELRELIEE